ncbi:SMI1/KNR4 family protein [Streptomyces sp. NPDC059605]|uniref:SMI1/KNR4 family protein n=1 Tax=unclassified Streptomyces TaxID=2593676 RepID=UPI00369299DD
MAYQFDMVQSLASVVHGDGAGGVREFIRGFAAHWAKPLGDEDGLPEADLVAAEERLGLRLPPALREAYLLFGRRTDLTRNHDTLLGPSELYVDNGQEALVFRHENQGAVSWGILLEALGEEDPAVFVRTDLADKSAERWEPWLDRLSLALVETVLSESVQADDELCDFLLDFDEHGAGLLEQKCVRLPFPSYPACENGSGIRWFLGPDALLRDDDGAALYARGRTEEALDGIRDLIPGDWLNDFRDVTPDDEG